MKTIFQKMHQLSLQLYNGELVNIISESGEDLDSICEYLKIVFDKPDSFIMELKRDYKINKILNG